LTVPVTVAAAAATPGHTNATTSPAASHIVFPLARTIGPSVIFTRLFRRRNFDFEQTVHPTRLCAQKDLAPDFAFGFVEVSP